MNATNKVLLILTLLLIVQTKFGQNKEVYIDKLETSEDVESFFRSIDKRYEVFKIKNIGQFNNRRSKNDFCKRVLDSLGITKSFYKSDFDNNGLTDILAIGNYYDFNILVAMNFGKDSIKLNRLTRRSFQNCVFPKIVNDSIYRLLLSNSTKLE